MRRLRRILWNLVTALSLLLAVAVVVLWVRNRDSLEAFSSTVNLSDQFWHLESRRHIASLGGELLLLRVHQWQYGDTARPWAYRRIANRDNPFPSDQRFGAIDFGRPRDGTGFDVRFLGARLRSG